MVVEHVSFCWPHGSPAAAVLSLRSLVLSFVVCPQGVPMWEALGKRSFLSPDGKLNAARGGGGGRTTMAML